MLDVVVIGAGPAGVVAALRAADLGAKTALITRDEFGGMAANDGPVPVRTLAHAARLIREARQLSHYGIVPRQQRFSQYTRSLMKALDVPVINQYGLRPAVVKGTKEIAPLTAFRDLDKLGLLNNVTTFNFHPHLPHYELTTGDAKSVHVLGRQPIDPDRPHPFTAAGNTEFNALLWLPPRDQRAGNVLLVDSTNFTTLFGGTDSLENFWKNLAVMG